MEWLPTTIGITSARGSDMWLAELISDMMKVSETQTTVKTGRTAFGVDEVRHTLRGDGTQTVLGLAPS